MPKPEYCFAGWNIVLGGQNTGSSDATITQIQINGVPFSGSGVANGHGFTGTSMHVSVPSGSTFSITFALSSSSTGDPNVGNKVFSSGQTIQVVIITAAGNNYPASIVLP